MVTLVDLGLTLRPLQRRDKREWMSLHWANREWLGPWESQDPTGERNLPTYRQYIRAQDRASRERASFGWAITEGGPILGHITLSHISWGALRSGTIGYWVSRERAGEGIAPRAVALVSDFALEVLGLHRVEINIRPENAASLRVVEKLGFREEGIRRGYIYIDDDWRDHRSFALLAGERGSLVERLRGDF